MVKIKVVLKCASVLAIIVPGSGAFAAPSGWSTRYDQPEGVLLIHDSALALNGLSPAQISKPRILRTRMSYHSEQASEHTPRFWSVESSDLYSCADRKKKRIMVTLFRDKGYRNKIASHQFKGEPRIKIIPGSTDELVLMEANCDIATGKWKAATL